jgi:hypothetical protein
MRWWRKPIATAKRTNDEGSLAAAYAALGDAFLAEAEDLLARDNEPEALDRLMKARYSFLRVIVRYAVAKEDLAYARYQTHVCYARIAQLDTEEDDAMEQARRQLRIIINRFGDTIWAVEARKSLEKMDALGIRDAAMKAAEAEEE